MKLEKYKWTLPKNKIVVGLTGGICSGKSEVLKIFKNLGATTLSADDISAKILSSNKQVKAQISKKFGEKFTKKLLADKIFANPKHKLWLENLLHPEIIKQAGLQIKKSKKKLIIFEAPILFETKLESFFNLTLCIFADDKIRIKRALKRKITKTEFLKRNKTQILLSKKAMLSDIVIDNNGNTKKSKRKG